MILLDTCALLWLAADPKQLSEKAKNSISDHAGKLFISAISAFEIAIKYRNGKLGLPMDVSDWYNLALTHHGIHEIQIDGQISIASVQLPFLHQDPCDRIIIATAQINKLKIITSDKLIRQYQEADVLW